MSDSQQTDPAAQTPTPAEAPAPRPPRLSRLPRWWSRADRPAAGTAEAPVPAPRTAQDRTPTPEAEPLAHRDPDVEAAPTGDAETPSSPGVAASAAAKPGAGVTGPHPALEVESLPHPDLGAEAARAAADEAAPKAGAEAGPHPTPDVEAAPAPDAGAAPAPGAGSGSGRGGGASGPVWWSRPAEGGRPGEGGVAAVSDGGAGEGAEDGAAPRYDPWSVGPLQVPDRGKAGPRRLRVRQGVVFGVGIALLAGAIGGVVGVLAERKASTRLELPQAAVADRGRAPDSVAGIAATALPGVVTLHVSGAQSSATGTGFVLDGQGHILTNNHVVHGAQHITVTFSTGESVPAELVGGDTGYDLAVVQVTGVRGLRPLALGNSENVRVGDPVVAIGAPFDLSNTVTAGIISATGRPITAGGDKGDGSDVSYVDALQTDAPINPGNSGGPLLDARAQVIGINSAIRGGGDGGDGGDSSGQQRGSIGLGFAIPVNQGKRVAEELIRTGHATHPVIGVTLDMEYSGDGARVGEKGEGGKPAVVAGGPGARAGIKPGDVITKVDGVRVHGGDELVIKIRSHRPGDALALTVLRDGRERTLEVVLGSANGS
ncbi:S1C family serine protease [Streptomyces sp. NBC_00503]|uniref:S1C family serine protease n=1 Tax=Streptomyces sp. NBC_00503 TaxID=2903659 RepID=UPI002E81E429|nr:trypsin-like peptidase domain-containing protein [Streptomyces sp. NBC_00503]WUD83439.1 trypsin-like peptidase domain-containing protein [Streptomyces sp. NBC_00503]